MSMKNDAKHHNEMLKRKAKAARAVHFTIDDVIETVNAMAKSIQCDDEGYTLTNCDAWERQDHNETVRQIAEKLTNKFKLGIE
jgi:hypothetical protein